MDKTAQIEIAPTMDLAGIAEKAGQPDPQARRYAAGTLFVAGVTQAALEQAAADADPLIGLRLLALDAISRGCDSELADVRNRYPVSELQTWPSQHREAAAYDDAREAGSKPPATPMLDGIAAARGITTPEQVDRVLAAVERYTTAAAAAVGKRQRLEAEIEAAYQAGDREALEAIAW